jgi:hypothetical protein
MTHTDLAEELDKKEKRPESDCKRKSKNIMQSGLYTGITTGLNVLSLVQLFSG